MEINMPDHIIAAAGVVAMWGFIPFSAYSFVHHRLPKKQQQYNRMLKQMGYTGGHAPAYLPRLDEEFRSRDYFAPVLFASVITLLGAIVLIFGGELLRADGILTPTAGVRPGHFVSLLLEGPGLVREQNGNPIVLGTLMLGLAFAGAYIWSVQNLFRRLSTLDLSPGVYYSVGQRIIFSMFVALLLYYLFVPAPSDGESISTALTTNEFSTIAIAAFLAGMFPQRMLDRLKEKVDHFMTPAQNRADPLPLDMIEGIQAFEKLRLGEVGIDNAQNLGKAHFLELIIRTPFNPREVIDWIGQARLYLFFKNDIDKLRGAGVRTVFDFRKVARVDGGLQRVAKQSGVPLERLQTVAEVVHHDADVDHLEAAIAMLVGFEPNAVPQEVNGPADGKDAAAKGEPG